jgi:hypothetical protein
MRIVPATVGLEEGRTIEKMVRTPSFGELLSAQSVEGYIFHARFAGYKLPLAVLGEQMTE